MKIYKITGASEYLGVSINLNRTERSRVMERQLGYQRSDEVKLVRRKHMIGFKTGTSAATLRELLEKIPTHATVDEVIDDEYEEGGNDLVTIEFHSEQKGAE